MKFTRSGSVQLIAGVIAGASAIVVACGGDDSTDGTTTTGGDAGNTSSGSTSSSSGATSSSSSSGSTTSSSGGTDAGGDAAKEAGGGDGGLKANGEACTQGTECQTGECFVGNKASFCTIKCTMPGNTDPVCQALGAKFSGKCNSKSFCELAK